MKLDELEILNNLVTIEGDKILTSYYRYVRPSSEVNNDSDETILKYGIPSYIKAIITENAVARLLEAHYGNNPMRTCVQLGGSYSTYEEQQRTLKKPDFCLTKYDGQTSSSLTLEVKSTEKKDYLQWINTLHKYNEIWKIHKADTVYLFSDVCYDRDNKTFTVGDIYIGFKQGKTYAGYLSKSGDELRQYVKDICDEVGIKCILLK